MRLYWRPPDSRARILIMTKDTRGQDLHCCMPLVNLKIIRDRSSLQLCRARRDGRDGRYALWARLNFAIYESRSPVCASSPTSKCLYRSGMVLFYCTFVAMKHQDERKVPHDNLIDHFELGDEEGEAEIFGGQIKHGELRHALRLFKDRSSGVVRLEACALRGPKKDVPLWTAFITKYKHDPDWAYYEGGGLVTLAAVRPPPYVFVAGYEPLRRDRDEMMLQFTTSDGKASRNLLPDCC